MEKYVSVQDDCFLATVIDGWGFETPSNEINAWDYQMADYVAVRERYSLFPRKSLVRNIGFMLDSTHSAEAPSWYTDNSYDFDVHAPDTLVIDEAYTKKYESDFYDNHTLIIKILSKITPKWLKIIYKKNLK